MATFKIEYRGFLVPKETTTLSDGSETITSINSNIDKVFGSSIEKSFGTSSANVKYKEYLTTTSGVLLSHSSIFNSSPNIKFLFIRIVSAGSSGTPNCIVAFDSTPNYFIKLSGVNDFCMIPLDDGGGIYALTAGDIRIMSEGSTTVANIEIIIGCY